ncbi:hypothetical protein Q7C18_04250 [Nesterenkonia sp. CL21]|uniref:hypothetical protein n=1 Tax=Nesterenkonia sp. CL21 TaxID=3064894 RepID=UPI00287AE8A6|nr:hypothetical protein [Nesterenkonia sp. CL21]MDS2171901.1 hypothetical protein [Nesterenkonia sp. CL21]
MNVREMQRDEKAMQRLRLRRTRLVLRGLLRDGGTGPALYVGGILVVFGLLPAFWVLGELLAEPLHGVVRAGADRVALGASAVQALGLWAGIRCGPALMSPFSAHVLMATGIPRAQVLGRAALRNMTLGTLLVGITSASLILSASRGSLEQGAAGGPTLLVVLASLVLGGQASLAWAVGQRVGPGAASGIVALILVLSGSATLWSPTILLTTGGWYGLLATGQVPTPAAWMLLAAAGALTACAWVMYRALPSGLSSVPTTRIMVQAQCVESALLLAGGGDLRRAAEATRPPPRRRPPMRLGHSVQKATHRRLSAVSVGWRQDAAASLRHPGQALRSVVLLMAAGMVAGLVGPTTGYGGEDVVSGTAAMLALCLLLDAGLAGVSPGLRGLQEELQAAPLFGWSRRELTVRHGLWPVAVASSCVLIGCVVAGLWWPEHEGGIGAGGWSSLEAAAQGACWAVAAVVVMFSCRLLQEVTSRDAPLLGIPPVPTPVGDLTGVLLLLGSIRGVLTAAAMLGALAVLIHEPWTQAAATAVLAAVAALASLLGAPRLAESR